MKQVDLIFLQLFLNKSSISKFCFITVNYAQKNRLIKNQQLKENNMLESSTIVTYPRGDVRGNSTVLMVSALRDDPDNVAIFVKETPFHPVDYAWADQPADKGTLSISGVEICVIRCLTAAIKAGTEEVFIDHEITARRGDPDWYFLVAHIVERSTVDTLGDIIGAPVELAVNEEYRRKLSETHTGCHLAALALNKATSGFWSKEIKRDSLGHPDLDSMTIANSKIDDICSTDTYRFGKSIRKKGLDVAGLLSGIADIQSQVNGCLVEWLSVPLVFKIVPLLAFLAEARKWQCTLPEGLAEIPCGGTHLDELPERSGRIEVDLEITDDRQGM